MENDASHKILKIVRLTIEEGQMENRIFQNIVN